MAASTVRGRIIADADAGWVGDADPATDGIHDNEVKAGDPWLNGTVLKVRTQANDGWTTIGGVLDPNNPTFTGTVTVPDAVNPTDAAQLSDATDAAAAAVATPAADSTFSAHKGPVLVDESDGHTYRIKSTAGVLGTTLVS